MHLTTKLVQQTDVINDLADALEEAYADRKILVNQAYSDGVSAKELATITGLTRKEIEEIILNG